MKARLEISERRQAGLLVLAPIGRIDNRTSAEFLPRLLVAEHSGSADVVPQINIALLRQCAAIGGIDLEIMPMPNYNPLVSDLGAGR